MKTKSAFFNTQSLDKIESQTWITSFFNQQIDFIKKQELKRWENNHAHTSCDTELNVIALRNKKIELMHWLNEHLSNQEFEFHLSLQIRQKEKPTEEKNSDHMAFQEPVLR
ncbi:MAG: hypothetical protein N4A41_08075 [Crocinitomicaceae bacterium]|jgi:hypothetical protein|nr:hypothetical protein [Crocinitomicaceae bacterium]